MSSIAYITDKNMIEFHRIHGNTEMNFWRPSSSKRFADFFAGDLLFFLAKGTEHGLNREKGIIGYGRYTEANMFSFRQMWNRFNVKNGYTTPNELKEAILKVSKSKTLAPQFHCLTLKDVVFFQSPVYLSEIGIGISSSVESYIYLEREDPQATAKILNQANIVGIDAWSATVSDHAPDATVFDDDLIRQVLKADLSSISDNFDTQREVTKAQRMLRNYQKAHPEFESVDIRGGELIGLADGEVRIILPFVSLKNDLVRKALYIIGKCKTIESFGERLPANKRRPLRFALLCDSSLPQETTDFFTRQGIQILDPQKENE